METPAFKCPACGSEKYIAHAEYNVSAGGQVSVRGKQKQRQAWKDTISVEAISPVAVKICAECGHISFWTKDLAKIRAASAKLGDESKL